jgi:UDP-N-acetylglucosamine acyltransferase
MGEIHPTTTIEGEVRFADDVAIGPHCVVIGPVTIESGTRLIGNVYLQGPLTIGRGNVIYPFTCLGFAPQHAKFDPNQPGQGLVIGDDNTFREHVTIHRAFTTEGPTRIGDRNYFMATSHAGHDCMIGDDCTFVNGSMLGGHVIVQDHVIVGGGSTVHQFVRLGHGAMLSGGMGTGLDLPPWFMLTGNNICGSVNLVGLRRSGMSSRQIDEVRWVYRTLYRQGMSLKQALEVIKERADSPLIAEYVRFIESSERGICTARPKAARGTA